MTVRLFVYGTLKEGFPNFHLNIGRRVPGDFVTRQPYELYVVRLPHEDRAPWLVDAGGTGHRIRGQVFEIDAEALAEVDRFEEVGLPCGYERVNVALDGPEGPTQAYAYLKQAQQLADCLKLEGPFEDYTLELAAGYWIRAA